MLRSTCAKYKVPPAPAKAPRARWRLALAAAAGLLSGCSLLPYYAQAVSGQLSLWSAARPVDDLLADPATPEDLRRQLRLALRIRAYAAHDLGLPDNRSYTRYADLHRSSVVWNVFATPPYSLTLRTWCYPVFGCAAYRGYFHRDAADALARDLAAEGLDTTVGPVPAYSTLGWFSDPLLNTFIRWPEPELARLVFHELAHQVVYVRDDTRFNESFASTVERAGLQRWVASRDDAALRGQYEQYRLHHDGMRTLVDATRADLERLYASGATPADMAEGKRAAFAALQQRYHALRDGPWAGYAGYDTFFDAPWNNARIAALAAYQDDVPAFEALLAREGGDLPRFYAAVRRLASLPADQRRAELAAALQTGP